jgi:hypothetical protein
MPTDIRPQIVFVSSIEHTIFNDGRHVRFDLSLNIPKENIKMIAKVFKDGTVDSVHWVMTNAKGKDSFTLKIDSGVTYHAVIEANPIQGGLIYYDSSLSVADSGSIAP